MLGSFSWKGLEDPFRARADVEVFVKYGRCGCGRCRDSTQRRKDTGPQRGLSQRLGVAAPLRFYPKLTLGCRVVPLPGAVTKSKQPSRSDTRRRIFSTPWAESPTRSPARSPSGAPALTRSGDPSPLKSPTTRERGSAYGTPSPAQEVNRCAHQNK